MAEKKVETTNVEDQDVKPGAPDVQGPAALPTRERQQFANSELPICDASHPLHKFLLDAMELAKNVDGLNQDDWSRERSTCAKCHLPTAQAYLRTAHQASLSDWEVGGLLRSFMETLLSEHSRGLPGAGGKTEAGQYLETRIEAKVKEFKTPYRGVIFGPSLFGSKQSTTFSQSQKARPDAGCDQPNVGASSSTFRTGSPTLTTHGNGSQGLVEAFRQIAASLASLQVAVERVGSILAPSDVPEASKD